MKNVTIFGGSGFLGRYIVRNLAANGFIVKVAVRNPNQALFLKMYGYVGQIELVAADVSDQNSIEKSIEGSDCVINCVAIFFETSNQSFKKIHVESAKNIAKVSYKMRVKSLIHISSLGASGGSPSQLLNTKGLGEKEVMKNYPEANIVRPSLIYGAEDNFFNRFAKICSVSPFVPMIGANTKFQPVYVDDVAQAICFLVKHEHKGRYLELGGNKIYTFGDLIQILLLTLNKKRILLKIPFTFAIIAGAINDFLSIITANILPSIVTVAQVRSLMFDNIVGEKSEKFEELGIVPRDLELTIPTYLERYKKS